VNDLEAKLMLEDAEKQIASLTDIVGSLIAQMNTHGIKPKIRFLNPPRPTAVATPPKRATSTKPRKKRVQMTLAMAAWIRERLEMGHKQCDIARDMDVSKSAVSLIHSGKWRPRQKKAKSA
jgi:hypothetical protein